MTRDRYRRVTAAQIQARETLERERFVNQVMAVTGWDEAAATRLNMRLVRLSVRTRFRLTELRRMWMRRFTSGQWRGHGERLVVKGKVAPM